MKKYLLLFLLMFLCLEPSASLFAQPAMVWDKIFGGTGSDDLTSLQQTSDGGYILGGSSNSAATADKSENGKGSSDYWIVKLNANGDKEWDRTIGGIDFEYRVLIRQTTDGGYIMGADSYSGIGADKSEPNGGTNNPEDRQPDIWIVKLSANGTIQWEKSLVQRGEEQISELRQTTDGGYLVLGSGSLFKVSADGAIEWQRQGISFFGQDQAGNVHTADGGYVLANSTLGSYYITKLNADGSEQWEKVYRGDGTGSNASISVVKIIPDGLMIGGVTDYGIGGDKSEDTRGAIDYWILKVDANGNKIWDKTFGGSGNDRISNIDQITDGGYLLGGTSDSEISGDKTEANNGVTDAWIIKIKADGTRQWDRVLGGTKYQQNGNYNGSSNLSLLVEDNKENYILTGFSNGNASEDKSSDTKGVWMVKLSADGTSIWDRVTQEYIGIISTKDGGYLGFNTFSTPAATQTEKPRGSADYRIIKFTAEATSKTLTASASSLAFNYTPGKVTPVQAITITAGTGQVPELSFVKSEGSKWLTVEQGTEGKVAFSVNATGVQAGTYNAFVFLFAADFSRIVVPVTFTVIGEEANNTYVRINAGGDAFVTPEGKPFRADQYFSGTDSTYSIASGDILNTFIDKIYRSTRNAPSFSYNIPVPNGKAVVTLHFAEMWYGVLGKGTGGAGKRQFHVDLEGKRILTDFDIFAEAGGSMRAVTKSFPVTITDSILNIEFLSGTADMPMVSAIEVITSSIVLKPIADAYVADGDIDGGGGGYTNYGSEPQLEVKNIKNAYPGRRYSYLKFSIGTAAIAGNVKLRVYGSNVENTKGIYIDAYGVDDDNWLEDRIASYMSPRISTPILGAVLVNNVVKYYEVDVTSYVKAQQQAGEVLVSFVLNDSRFQDTKLVFNSRENEANSPQLVIVPAPEVPSEPDTEEPPLPVTLIGFTAEKESMTGLLNWQTSSETHSGYFEIQHSSDGKAWEILGTSNAKGESSEISNYQFVHFNPLSGENLYRLKMVDADGTFTYSKINTLTFDADVTLILSPNPVSENLSVQISDPKNVITIQLLNSSSFPVYNSGRNPKFQLDVSKLESGLYFLQIFRMDGTFVTRKVLIAR